MRKGVPHDAHILVVIDPSSFSFEMLSVHVAARSGLVSFLVVLSWPDISGCTGLVGAHSGSQRAGDDDNYTHFQFGRGRG